MVEDARKEEKWQMCLLANKCGSIRKWQDSYVYGCDKIIARVEGSQVKEACVSINLCAGLEEGIKGNIQKMCEREELGRADTGE